MRGHARRKRAEATHEQRCVCAFTSGWVHLQLRAPRLLVSRVFVKNLRLVETAQDEFEVFQNSGVFK